MWSRNLDRRRELEVVQVAHDHDLRAAVEGQQAVYSNLVEVDVP